MGFCEIADLYAYGLPRGAAPAVGRLAGSVSVAADTVELDAHGFVDGTPVRFRAEAGGSLPSPLAEGVTYFALPTDESHFRVAATADGAAIGLSTAGARVVVVTDSPRAAAIEFATALIEDMLPAHVLPLVAPYPPVVVMTCAELAAWKLLTLAGTETRTLAGVVEAAQKRLARWARGVPIRGTNAPQAAGLAAGAGAPATDSRGWRAFGGLL